MKIKLDDMQLDRFRNLSGSFQFGDKNTFKGKNGTGKTTLFDASTWCLYGVDSKGEKNFEVKQLEKGSADPDAVHSATCLYDIDGKKKEFKREYYEKWTNKRQEGLTKTGNETKYYVDGLELKKKEFDQEVEDAFTKNFRLCSDMYYLTNLHWKERREILKPLVNVDEGALLIESGIADFLNGKDVEKLKALNDQNKKRINKELIEINAAIKERSGAVLAESKGVLEAEKEVEAVKKILAGTRKKINDCLTGGETNKQIAELRQKQRGFEDEHSKKLDLYLEQRRNKRSIDGEISRKIEQRIELDRALDTLREEWRKIKKGFDHPCQYYDENCPYFGMQHNSEGSLNKRKSEVLEQNVKGGKNLKERLEKIGKEIEALDEELGKLNLEEPKLPVEIEQVNKQIEELQNKTAEEVPRELQHEVETAETALNGALEEQATARTNKANVDRVAELKEKKQLHLGEMDKIEAFLSKYDEYSQLLADRIEKPLNGMFKKTRFKMFDKLENGSTIQACEVLDDRLRPFDGALSHGEQIETGLDIVQVMQGFFGISAPIWIDESGEYTGEIGVDCQYFQLFADANYNTLTQV